LFPPCPNRLAPSQFVPCPLLTFHFGFCLLVGPPFPRKSWQPVILRLSGQQVPFEILLPGSKSLLPPRQCLVWGCRSRSSLCPRTIVQFCVQYGNLWFQPPSLVAFAGLFSFPSVRFMVLSVFYLLSTELLCRGCHFPPPPSWFPPYSSPFSPSSRQRRVFSSSFMFDDFPFFVVVLFPRVTSSHPFFFRPSP